MSNIVSLFGLLIFLLIPWALSEGRSRINYRLVVWGLLLQFIFAVLILKTAPGNYIFDAARLIITRILDFTDIGASFVFGTLTSDFSIGAIIAFRVLPTIIFISSLMGVLYYLRIIQGLVALMAYIMERTMRATGIEAFVAATFVFMGIEGITGIKSYIERMTRSELFSLMTAFMATIAGSVMAAYVSFGASAGHILAASVMSAPAALVISKLLVPELSVPELTERGGTEVRYGKDSFRSEESNIIEAAANGAIGGLRLAATIGAILIAFVALIGMADHILALAGLSFSGLSAFVFRPVAFIMGVPWSEAGAVGELLGIKVIFNEFISYQMLPALVDSGELSPRSVTIATYALCSFANFGSIAILIGGIGTLVPERKGEVVSLSLKALLAGTIAGFMTATVAGILL